MLYILIDMVQSQIFISEKANCIINIVKAQHGLKDKSEAIDFIAEKYAELALPGELRLKGD
jgi:hypothetical protein